MLKSNPIAPKRSKSMPDKPKIIMRGNPMPGEAPKAFLQSLGLWDKLGDWERRAFFERGEVHDTPGGNELAKAIIRIRESR